MDSSLMVTCKSGADAAVVIDPYSSGRYLLYELWERGTPIICVRSSQNLNAFFMRAYDANKEYFAETVDFHPETGVEGLVRALTALPYRVAAVFAGCEPGVQLTDELSEALGLLASNGTALTAARKNKAGMQDRLRECGVPAAEQFCSSDLDQLLSWARARGQWPVVVKPTGSSGSEGVFMCREEADLVAAHEELVGNSNANGTINEEVVLQEFLAGDEYIVDTVSFEGRHVCVAVWVYTKMRGTPWNPNCIVNMNNRLMPAAGDVQDRLVGYVFDVLDAVGLQYGPCHTEVMLTPRGPILVEVNARLHGLQGPKLIGLATGTSKAMYAVDALLGGGKLITERLGETDGSSRFLYPLIKECVQMVLISPAEGYLKCNIKNAILDMALPSVVEIIPSFQKGQWLPQTCDLNTAAGYVLMVHASDAQIQADMQCIREAERSGALYLVSQEPLHNTTPPSPRSEEASTASPRSPLSGSPDQAQEYCGAEKCQLEKVDNFELVGIGK